MKRFKNFTKQEQELWVKGKLKWYLMCDKCKRRATKLQGGFVCELH